MDVEKRLFEDATSFTKEVASLDHEGFTSRTLAALGILPNDTDTTTEEVTPEAGRTQRPAPAGDDSEAFVKTNRAN